MESQISGQLVAGKMWPEMVSGDVRRALLFLEHVPAMGWAKNAAGAYVYVNGEYERATGRTIDEIRGRTDDELWPADHAKHFRANDARVLSTGQPVQDIESGHHVAGLRHYLVTKFPVFDASGAATHVGGIALDITDKHQMEQALEDSESVLRSFYESIPCMMGVVEVRGDEVVYVSCNPATARAHGVTPAEMQGQPVTRFGVTEETTRFWIDRYRASLLARQPVSFEISRERDGVLRWFRATVCPIVRLSQHPQFCYFSEDITRQRQAQDDLRRAKEAAEAASRAKSEFLANMSHEIRTPMTSILGFAEALLDPALTAAERAAAIATIQRNGKHLMDVLNDILDLSKIEAGQLGVEPRTVALWDILAEVTTSLRPRAAAKGIDFSLHAAQSLPEHVMTDPTRLRQILLNLVGNAVKFTDRGAVHVTASLKESGSGRAPLVEITVKDTGVGISESDAGKLFEPFVQGDASATRRHGGTGLGLAISRKLAQMLGGTISFTSKPGVGSTFVFTFSAGVVPQPQTPPRVGDVHRDGGRRLSGHVLLVEDSADTRALVSHFLKKAGLTVSTALHGADACDLFARPGLPPVDLVLMDMQMPVMDGYSATQELRRRGEKFPIIALTANAMKDDEERCLKAGCTGYLTKPIDRETLISAVAAWVA